MPRDMHWHQVSGRDKNLVHPPHQDLQPHNPSFFWRVSYVFEWWCDGWPSSLLFYGTREIFTSKQPTHLDTSPDDRWLKRLMASTTTTAAKGKMAVIKHSSSGQVDLESCRCCHKSWSLQRRNFFGATLSHRITIVTQLAQSWYHILLRWYVDFEQTNGWYGHNNNKKSWI